VAARGDVLGNRTIVFNSMEAGVEGVELHPSAGNTISENLTWPAKREGLMKHLIILSGVVCLSFMLLPSCAPQTEEQVEPVSEEAPSTEADVTAINSVDKKFLAASGHRSRSKPDIHSILR
jgi:hypothetical protein